MKKQVVVSGIRPTGKLHIGNYLGALKKFAEYSKDPSSLCYLFVADWHGLTTPRSIPNDITNIILDYLAVGVDYEKTVIYLQSSVKETLELCWYLSCMTSVGDLERVSTYQERKELHPEINNAGLLIYPTLMAADILGPQADIVPVGADQLPHVEMAQGMARRFNSTFGTVFTIPSAVEQSVQVPGVGGSGKMGKSEGNTITLDESTPSLTKKIHKAKTDEKRKQRTDPGDPSVCNMYTLHTLLSEPAELSTCFDGCKNATMGCGDCKEILTKNIQKILEPIQERRKGFETQKDLVPDLLSQGAMKAQEVIAETVSEVREKVGIISWQRSTS